jgi:predicted metallopeptidase
VLKFLRYSKKKTTQRKQVDWQQAPDIKKRVLLMSKTLSIDWVIWDRVFFYRSYNSSSRAYARTWGFPRIWQMALNETPAYVIEVISERFDKLDQKVQDKILLHEIIHIPKNFSGSLIAHTRRGKGSFHSKLEQLINKYLQNMS